MFGIDDFYSAIIDYSNFEISQLGNAFVFGGAMLLIGIATVFSVLALLWLCLTLFKLFFHDLPAKRAANAIEENAAPEAVVADTTSEDEIVAVIAAAIAAAESENSGVKFRVVSFNRK